jgi:hypothetical protein
VLKPAIIVTQQQRETRKSLSLSEQINREGEPPKANKTKLLDSRKELKKMGKKLDKSDLPWHFSKEGKNYQTVYANCKTATDVVTADRPEAIGYEAGASESWKAYLGRS